MMFSRVFFAFILFFVFWSCDRHQNLQQKIVIFTKATCFYCKAAKDYLQERNLSFEEIEFNKHSERDLALLNTYAKASNADIGPYITVPQIFIGKHYVGGFSDLRKINNNDLQNLLK